MNLASKKISMKSNKFTHKCKICEDETNVSFNIDFKQVYICEGCARAITTQQVIWYSKTYLKDDKGRYITRKV